MQLEEQYLKNNEIYFFFFSVRKNQVTVVWWCIHRLHRSDDR